MPRLLCRVFKRQKSLPIILKQTGLVPLGQCSFEGMRHSYIISALHLSLILLSNGWFLCVTLPLARAIDFYSSITPRGSLSTVSLIEPNTPLNWFHLSGQAWALLHLNLKSNQYHTPSNYCLFYISLWISKDGFILPKVSLEISS